MEKLSFSNVSILVIGDVILDKYFIGSVERISSEAPVPVVNIKERKRVLGGAANVANNIVGLNSNTHLIGVAGRDIYKEYLLELLNQRNIPVDLIETTYPTITKIRVIGNHQQVVRLDFEEAETINDENEKEVIKKIDKIIIKFNAIVISDYAKGLCTEKVCQFIIKKAKKYKIPVIVDPKGINWIKYNGATVVTPNVKELSDICGEKIENNNKNIELYGKEILNKFKMNNLLITRSGKGMTLISENKIIHFPTEAKEVYDVSGAGDTVAAILAVAFAMNKSCVKSVEMANKAAGIIVSKFGVVPILAKEFNSYCHQIIDSRIFRKDAIQQVINDLKEKKKKIIFTNGCFDILHRGHVTFLKKAKNLGDILIVGLNTDSSIKRLKGSDRPINNEFDRAEILISLESVDYIVFFDEDTPQNLIKKIKPDVLVKGADYKEEEIVGREFAKETILIDFVEGYSTTKLINKRKK